LSQKIPASGWGPGPGNLSQNGLKATPLMSLTKRTKSKICNIFSMQSKRLAASFEGLYSSLAQLPGEVWSCKVAGKYVAQK